MNARGARDRAVMWLGVVSILSAGFVFVKGELGFVQIPDAGVPVAVGLGLLALFAGWRGLRSLILLAGTGFVAAAAGQVALQTAASSLANGSNGSTFGLWLGLGAALLVLGLTPQPDRT